MAKPINDAWESYRDGVLPKDAPQVQVDECRKAFYAGAFSHPTRPERVIRSTPTSFHASSGWQGGR